MKIVVLGGGAQGRVIAGDLARALPDATICVADVREPRLAAHPNLRWVESDCSDAGALVHLLREHDFGVGALPSRLGYQAMRAAIAARRNLVDVSFSAEDPLTLDREAQRAGITIVPDCGLAPGLSNLVLGRALAADGPPRELMIMVGGVAEDPTRPYGYQVSWSLDDLLEEYVRPARIQRGGKPVTVPVFSGLERVQVAGVGEMEAFYSDGLRTLIDTLPGVPAMGEKTLRWPGHVDAVKPLVESKRFVGEFRARCVVDEPRDLVALVVRVRRGARERRMTLVDRYDPATRLTAMARTTALTTSAVAQLVAAGRVTQRGVLPLERIGPDEAAHAFLLERLARHGIRLAWTEAAAVV